MNASKHDSNCYTDDMFQVFPKDKRGWLRVLVFPFQAYVVAALVVNLRYHERNGDVASFGALFSLDF